MEQGTEGDEMKKVNRRGAGGRLRNRNHTSGEREREREREREEGGEKGQQLERMRQ